MLLLRKVKGRCGSLQSTGELVASRVPIEMAGDWLRSYHCCGLLSGDGLVNCWKQSRRVSCRGVSVRVNGVCSGGGLAVYSDHLTAALGMSFLSNSGTVIAMVDGPWAWWDCRMVFLECLLPTPICHKWPWARDRRADWPEIAINAASQPCSWTPM